ncbi:hypothetical protein AVEN_274215-1 [Araneus ventricosus]|uniref:Uncharacterized protein n=1 Tax=Araneus ventricosus TaxID=182803 RepID=A0A4Y2T1D5_ARAVE|nr:hypothetical protein AVEN_274215-1 [Araneus ventricosus]
MSCQALPSTLLPVPTVKLFFYWQGIETKINLVAPRRQNPQKLANRPATPCARPGDLQLANKGSYDSSDWRSRFLRRRVGIALTSPKGN